MLEQDRVKYNRRVEDFKKVEKFKLTIWIAKAFSSFVLIVGSIVILTYLYLAVQTRHLPDLGAVGSFLSGFFQVIGAIVE